MKAECTITWPEQLLQDATNLVVKERGMALWSHVTLTLLKLPNKHCPVPALGMSHQPRECTHSLADHLPTGVMLHVLLVLLYPCSSTPQHLRQ